MKAAIAEFVDEERRCEIKLAHTDLARSAAHKLISKMFAWRGYSVPQSYSRSPDGLTLLAESSNTPSGTMTLFFDGGDGLPADDTFKDKIDELRARGRILCEPGRLAIDRRAPKRIFPGLMHVLSIYGATVHGCTDYVIEVNPRHSAYYQRQLGFSEFCGVRTCKRVGAPAVLLRVEQTHMTEQARKLGGQFAKGGERSAYPFFFPCWDEYRIAELLVREIRESARSQPELRLRKGTASSAESSIGSCIT